MAGKGEGLRCIKAQIAFRARETSNQLWAVEFVAEIRYKPRYTKLVVSFLVSLPGSNLNPFMFCMYQRRYIPLDAFLYSLY